MKYNITQARKIITICYEIILDRNATKTEIDHWAKKLVSNEMSETDIVYHFVTSKEFQNKRKV